MPVLLLPIHPGLSSIEELCETSPTFTKKSKENDLDGRQEVAVILGW